MSSSIQKSDKMKLLLSQFQLRCVYSQTFSDEKPQSKAIEQDSNFVSLTLGTSAGARASEEINAGEGKGIWEASSPENAFKCGRTQTSFTFILVKESSGGFCRTCTMCFSRDTDTDTVVV